MNKLFYFYIFLVLMFFGGCGTSVYYVKPPDWMNLGLRDTTIQNYSKYIKGWKFYVDPGHGGKDRFNHGPANDVIEADINLSVSLALKEYLEKAGATVYISRTKDTTIDLLDRSKFSNQSGADFFISVHHNALGSNDHTTNYTSTWYHAEEGDSSYNPINHDIAKYVQRDLAYVMGNNGPLSSFDGTCSDYQVYPNSGFSVLRNAFLPGVLIEGSFFSSNYEEQRLKRLEFNQIEGWGIFRGIGKFFKNGISKLEFINEPKYKEYQPEIIVKIIDTVGLDTNSINVSIDSKRVKYRLDTLNKVIYLKPDYDLSNGEHKLDIVLQNKKGNHSLPFKKIFTIAPPVAKLKMNIYPKTIPPLRDVMAYVLVEAQDRKGNPVADGTLVRFSVTSGSITYNAYTSNGIAKVYVKAPLQRGYGVISGEADDVRIHDTVFYFDTKSRYITGIVKDSVKPIKNCGVILSNQSYSLFSPNFTTTSEDGRYILTGEFGDSAKFVFMKDGYFGKETSLALTPYLNNLDLTLNPIAEGKLFDKVFIIDPRYGGKETGEIYGENTDSKVNLEIANYLYLLLKASGAKVFLTRNSDRTIPEFDRAKITKDFRRGLYLRIDVSSGEKIGITQYPNIPNTEISKEILNAITNTTNLKGSEILTSREDIFSWSGIGTISVSLPSLNSSYFKKDNMKFLESELAWSIYRGILKQAGYSTGKTLKQVIVRNNNISKGKDVVVDYSLISATNDKGECIFYDLKNETGIIKLFEEINN